MESGPLFYKVVYGKSCGWAGIDPPYRDMLNGLISEKNTSELEKWLSSETTEIQVYGVEGFYSLKKKGYKPSEKQLQLIKIIKSKVGNLRTCSGCIYREETIKEAVARFKF